MKDSTGDPGFPIWLIGDSPPEEWADMLDTPLDPRHPARHNIWTSVADVMQDRLYREARLRLDTSRLYIRNAMSQPIEKSSDEERTTIPIETLSRLFDSYNPNIVLTFGVSAFMVALYASGEHPHKIFGTTKLLGEQFRSRVKNYRDDRVNVIPLLHVSISWGKFLESHRDFVDGHGSTPPNYFDYAGTELADLLMARFSDRLVWVV